ncbi:MAG TPA: phosphoenolpyruvate--protein phosphotransferase [Gammaproteobacteria bacterium]|nr:phosphoenolpyruvate--protein phosphotransferase [Gammaproteobacteria bacterium]
MNTISQGEKMITLLGLAVSPGMAKGKAYVYRDVLQPDTGTYKLGDAQVREEQARVERAIDDVRQSLTVDTRRIEARLGKDAADIFRAQEAMLCTSSVVEEIKTALEARRINAEDVIKMVFRHLVHRFEEMGDEVLQQRGDDIRDLSRRLLLSLAGIHTNTLENLPPNTVLIAHRLLPSDTVFLSRTSTVAVLIEFAGPAGHAALLARELGIPCVGGIPELLGTVHTGDVVLVDGSQGTAVINPDLQALQTYEDGLDRRRKHKETIQDRCIERAVTLDGIEVSVMANVRGREDVELAMACGADGIGLFRTEPFFLASKHFPSDEEFADFLLYSLQPAKGRHAAVRLLDIGADKNPIYLHLPSESDPFLGRRGVRLLLEYPDLLEAQLRAILKVSQQFRIEVVIPMVTTESDVVQVVQRFCRLADEMGISEMPRIGAMVETPAAALSISSLRKQVDFLSIGSNDLTQYTMAAGRENPMVTEYFRDDDPAILRLIELVVRESSDTPVCLCGELSGRADVMARLLATGIKSFSVPASLVPDVKDTIRKLSTLSNASL